VLVGLGEMLGVGLLEERFRDHCRAEAQQRLQHLLVPDCRWRMLMGGGTLLRVRVSSVVFVLTEDKSFDVRMVMGEEFSDKMFQNPGGYFPGRLIREPQL